MPESTKAKAPFDIDSFLAQPLVARVATADPTVRPVWYLWEEGSFWWLTGSYARLADILDRSPSLALIIDTCDLTTGVVYQVRAKGAAKVVPLDLDKAVRKLTRYLGPDQTAWDARFRSSLYEDDATRMVRFTPEKLQALDLSFTPALGG